MCYFEVLRKTDKNSQTVVPTHRFQPLLKENKSDTQVAPKKILAMRFSQMSFPTFLHHF